MAARGGARERLTLLLARFIGGGYVAFLILLAPSIRREYFEYAQWWPVPAVVLTFGPPVWMMWASLRGDRVGVGRAAIACAVGYGIAAVTWPLAWNGEVLGEAPQPPWLGMIPGLPALALALVARMPVVAPYAVVTIVVTEWSEFTRIPGPTMLPQILSGAGFSLIYATAVRMLLRTAQLLDNTRRTSRERAVAASAKRAEADERARFDALTHDWVMSTLLSAARSPNDPAVRRQARDAIERLEGLRGGALSDGTLDGESVAAQLRSAVTSFDPLRSATIDVVVERDGDGEYPADAAAALGAATAEAARNSLRHAGDDARRSVDITLLPAAIIVVILDDGIGFDPARVPPDRLGVTAAIRQQMATVPGGSAEVTSAPGRGTRVTLRWAADDA